VRDLNKRLAVTAAYVQKAKAELMQNYQGQLGQVEQYYEDLIAVIKDRQEHSRKAVIEVIREVIDEFETIEQHLATSQAKAKEFSLKAESVREAIDKVSP
jgi:hypothetical protein